MTDHDPRDDADDPEAAGADWGPAWFRAASRSPLSVAEALTSRLTYRIPGDETGKEHDGVLVALSGLMTDPPPGFPVDESPRISAVYALDMPCALRLATSIMDRITESLDATTDTSDEEGERVAEERSNTVRVPESPEVREMRERIERMQREQAARDQHPSQQPPDDTEGGE